MSFRTNALTLFLISSPDSDLRPTWKWKCQLNRYNWQACIAEISHQTRKQSLSFRFFPWKWGSFFVWSRTLIWNNDFFRDIFVDCRSPTIAVCNLVLVGLCSIYAFQLFFFLLLHKYRTQLNTASLLVDAGNSHAASETGSRPQAHGDSNPSPQHLYFL